MICEQSGICATIEFIGGELIYHTNERLPVKTLTNSTYADSLSFWRKEGMGEAIGPVVVGLVGRGKGKLGRKGRGDMRVNFGVLSLMSYI